MTEKKEFDREAIINKIKHCFNRTKENGASEEEMMSAIDLGMSLLDKYQIDMSEVDGDIEERKTYVDRWLNIKYGNKWRWELANSVAWNTGVYALHFSHMGSDGAVKFHGREHMVEAAAILAESLINQVERLSQDFAKLTGTGTTGKRRFARGCSVRVRQRVYQSHNLATDPRLPVIIKQNVDEAKSNFEAIIGKKVDSKRQKKTDEDSLEYYLGYKKGDEVKLRQETKEIG